MHHSKVKHWTKNYKNFIHNSRRNHKSKKRRPATIIIIGDFNTKIEDKINGNMSTVTKGWRTGNIQRVLDKRARER